MEEKRISDELESLSEDLNMKVKAQISRLVDENWNELIDGMRKNGTALEDGPVVFPFALGVKMRKKDIGTFTVKTVLAWSMRHKHDTGEEEVCNQPDLFVGGTDGDGDGDA